MDTLSPKERSRLMAKVRGKNTLPERLVRQLVSALGHRYRLHVKSLPGTPDLALMGAKKAIFVHGCFWHFHECRRFCMPKSRVEYWHAKLLRNRARDVADKRALRRLGWRTLVIWECQLRDRDRTRERLQSFLRQGLTCNARHLRKRNSAKRARGKPLRRTGANGPPNEPASNGASSGSTKRRSPPSEHRPSRRWRAVERGDSSRFGGPPRYATRRNFRQNASRS